MQRELGVLLLVFGAAPALAGEPYDTGARVAYVTEALEAARATPLDVLDDTRHFLDVAERNRCKSAFHRLRVACLVEEAKRACRARRGKENRRRCTRYADLIVVNKLSESRFLSAAEKYAIMRDHVDYRKALRAELRRRYAGIATAFLGTRRAACRPSDAGCLAAGVDAYCMEYTETHDLSWHQCAAALTWFIGTSGRPDPSGTSR
jgi:hypothetical protein